MRKPFLQTVLWVAFIYSMTLVSAVNGQSDSLTPGVYYADWSRDGSTIAVATNINLTIYNADFSVRSVWEQSDPNEVRRFYDLSPDGNRILTDGAVWDTFTLQPVFTTPDYYLGAWSADNNLILAVPLSELGFVTLSANTGEVTQTYMDGSYNRSGPFWSPDNRYFVGSDMFYNIYVVERDTARQIVQLPRTNSPIAFAWHPDSTMFMFAERVGQSPNVQSTLYTVDIPTGQIESLITIDGPASRIRWSPDGHQLVIAAVSTSTLYVVDVPSLEYQVYSLPTFPNDVVYSSSGGQLLLNYNIYRAVSPINVDERISTDIYTSHSLMNGAVQIIVPDPSLERLEAIAAACDAPLSLMQPLAAQTSALSDEAVPPAALDTFVAQLDALPADTIPPGCAADLRAVAQAIEVQME